MTLHRNSEPARRRWRRRWQSLRGLGGVRVLAAALGGLLLYAGFAPSTLWWAPIVGFALFGLAAHGRGWKASAGLGLVCGAILFFPLLSFTNIYVGNVPWVALATAEALLVMPAAALLGPISRRLPAWPLWGAAAWIAGEALRAHFPFGGFPWGGIAFTQADGPLLPIAAVVGEAGLAFAVALAGLALGELFRRGVIRWRPRLQHHRAAVTTRDDAKPAPPVAHSRWFARTGALIAPAILVALPVSAGVASLPAVQTGDGASTSPIAVIQGNVPEPGLKFNARRRAVLDMHAAETDRLARAVAAGEVPQPAVVLWPENSSDIDPYRNADAADVIDNVAKKIGVPILVGAVVGADQPRRVYNMGIVWDPVTGPGATYTKRHPLPFGEYMPWRSFFRIFSDKVDLITADFLPGDKPGNLTVNGVSLGDVICFEIVEDGLVRDVVNGGAEVLVVQTNNATFGYTNETYQQQAMSRVRAVEYGREVLITSTSGVSAVIGPDGTVEGSIPLFTAGYSVPDVPLITATTPGTVLGAPLRWVLTAASPLALAVALLLDRRRRTRSRAAHTKEPVIA